MSRGVNKVILIGNLGQDPDTRYTPSGNAVVNLNLATDESYKDRQTGQVVPKTEWHRVVLFGKPAEIISQYCRKGSKLYIEGKLQTRKWQSKEGHDMYTTEIVVSVGGDFQLLDGRKDDGANPPPQGNRQQNNQRNDYYQHSRGGAAPAGQANNGQGNQQSGYNMPEPVDDFDDDIPFNLEAGDNLDKNTAANDSLYWGELWQSA